MKLCDRLFVSTGSINDDDRVPRSHSSVGKSSIFRRQFSFCRRQQQFGCSRKSNNADDVAEDAANGGADGDGVARRTRRSRFHRSIPYSMYSNPPGPTSGMTSSSDATYQVESCCDDESGAGGGSRRVRDRTGLRRPADEDDVRGRRRSRGFGFACVGRGVADDIAGTSSTELESYGSCYAVKTASGCNGTKNRRIRFGLVLVGFAAVFVVGLVVGGGVTLACERGVLTASPLSLNGDGTTGHRRGDQYTANKGRQKELLKLLLQPVNRTRLRENLRFYTSHVHITGTHSNSRLREVLLQQLGHLTRLSVRRSSYNTALSYPDWERPNFVRVLNGSGSVLFETGYSGPPVEGDSRPADHPEVTEPYIAFSPNGTAEGCLVDAAHGRPGDYDRLTVYNVSTSGCIVLVSVADADSLTQLVDEATHHEAVGVVVYYAPRVEPSATADDRRGPPDWAAVHGSLYRRGDPTTPGEPSTEWTRRLPLDAIDVPKIPVHTVSSLDAHQLRKYAINYNMETEATTGASPTGSGTPGARSTDGNATIDSSTRHHWENLTTVIAVFNELERREITNIFGVIEGHAEPDRYVIVGCHYDSWSYGAAGPSSGTAVLTELASVFDHLISEAGWRPRRTIVFAHWDAGEMTLGGAVEWVEDHHNELFDRVVAYINVDAIITGDDHLEVYSSAILSDLVRDVLESAVPVPTSDGEPGARSASPTDSSLPLSPAAATAAVTAASSTTMTAVTFPSNETSATSQGNGWTQLMRVTTPAFARGLMINDDSRPTRSDAVARQTGSGNVLVSLPANLLADTDLAPFHFTLGAPVVWPRFVAKSDTSWYHARRMSEGTLEHVERFVDPTNLRAHVAATRVVAAMLFRIADALRLPVDVRLLATRLEQLMNGLTLRSNGNIEIEGDILQTFDGLQHAIDEFVRTAAIFHSQYSDIDGDNDEVTSKRYNDRVMRVSTAFINPYSLGHTPPLSCCNCASANSMYRNLLSVPGDDDGSFPGIQRALRHLGTMATGTALQRHLAVDEVQCEIARLTAAVVRASRALRDGAVL